MTYNRKFRRLGEIYTEKKIKWGAVWLYRGQPDRYVLARYDFEAPLQYASLEELKSDLAPNMYYLDKTTLSKT